MSKKLLDIREVKQLPVNSEFYVMGVVSRLTRRKDRNDRLFWDITLSDEYGEITGKIWSDSTWYSRQGGDNFPIDPDNCGLKFEGSSLGVSGRVSEFRELLQYNFSEVYYLDQEKFPPVGFVRHSPIDINYLEKNFYDLIAEIKHKKLHDFVFAVFFKHGLWDKFKTWPGAISIHHAYMNGLLEHSVSMTMAARDLAKHYHENFKIPVNIDLVIAGALIHDIGKLESYNLTPTPQMTLDGNVIDHIVLGYNLFRKLAEIENLDENITRSLGHIIISHHGLREYGSPVLPATPEAIIVSAADDLDFKLNFWKNQIDALNPQSEMTDYLSFVDRRLWRGVEINS
ncbi:MAG: HD domain-containing protein [Synergistaceae bacterium]|nr:HD domain-containing protein [Synergistaceae bacterium]